MSRIVKSPIESSLVWMVARTIPENPECDETEEVRYTGFVKEFHAACIMQTPYQKVSYSDFFKDPVKHPQAYFLRRVADTFVRRMQGCGIIFPKVNRTKNVSSETRIEYNHLIDPSVDYVRTVDLEVAYYKTGIQCQGCCEMRAAWKFNDLKPRCYYCQGGTLYWPSRYIKVFATELLKSIPSTFTKIRINPELNLQTDSDEDYIMAWDFTAFTTSLGELKHFLWYIARLLERSQVFVQVFDYRKGVIRLPAWDLLDEYNELVNMHSEYSVYRIVDKLLETKDTEWELVYQMNNSGPLGVAGNIGFSTALHGVQVCRICGPRRCVCVGDDALGITKEDPNRRLIAAIRSLGTIHPEKFDIMYPQQQDDAIRFLKRRFSRSGTALFMSVLFDFPVTAYIDCATGHRTIPADFSVGARQYKIATHVGSLLWEIHSLPDQVTDPDMEIVTNYLRTAYRYLRMPFSGFLPGYSSESLGPTPCQFCLPPVPSDEFDPRKADWLEWLLDHTPQTYFDLPVFVLKAPTPFEYLSKGDKVMLPESQFLSALEDIGVVTLKKLREKVYVGEESNRRRLAKWVRNDTKDMVQAYVVQFIHDIPYAWRSPSGLSMECSDYRDL